MTVFVLTAAGCQAKTAAVGEMLLLVIVAPEGPLGRLQRSWLKDTPELVTEAVIVNEVPNIMFVSGIELIPNGPKAWP